MTEAAEKQVKTRRTRFVCISDTHNSFPGAGFKLPPGDVLIHAGDLTNQGSYEELEKAVRWIEESDYEVKIVVAGNHDITMDTGFYNQYGLYFHSPSPYDTAKCRALLENSPSITYLRHEPATICLDRSSGPQTTFKIFGSPYSPAKDMWAFGYSPSESLLLWDAIPFDTDIVVTHIPPKYHLDEREDRRSVGCPSLRERLWRVRPRLVVCGHVHESRGADVVTWDLTQSNVKYKERETVVWNDPGAGEGNKKFSIVNLTRKNGGVELKNDGGVGDRWQAEEEGKDHGELRKKAGTTNLVGATFSAAEAFKPPDLPTRGKNEKKAKKAKPKVEEGVARLVNSLAAIPVPSLPPATIGQGGMPPSGRCDIEALSGRMGRLETCVVNAAIMANSYGNRAGGKKFNKPIVVDLDLPVWRDNG